MTTRLPTAPRALALLAALLAALAALTAAPAARAQGGAVADAPDRATGLDSFDGALSPVWQRWTFGDALTQDSLRVRGVSQLAIPFRVRMTFGERWSGDVSGAVARSVVDYEDDSRQLGGLADVRLRAVGRLRGDNLLLTLGLNLPTGRVELDDDELDALQVVGAPALGLTVPIFGAGLGATVGLVAAREGPGGWAYAAGASVEQRTTYTASELVVARVRTPTDVRPGRALHLSLGADGLVRGGRLSLFAVGDLFGEDEIRVRATPFQYERTTYRLGPALTTGARYEFPAAGFRELTATVTNRYRMKFRDGDGNPVDGSSGDALTLAVTGVTGAAGTRGVLLGLHGRFDTGLAVDDRVATAAARLVGATVGLAIPRGRFTATPSLRATLGTLDVGPASASARELALGLTITAR